MHVHDHDRADYAPAAQERAEHSAVSGVRGRAGSSREQPNAAQLRALRDIGVDPGVSAGAGAPPVVQRLVADTDHDPAGAWTVSAVLRRPGRPLPAALRLEMEARLGADFADVRLHTDQEARRSADAIGAAAYTSGNNVVIGDQGTDKRTLAHELSHVLQQRSGPVSGTDHGHGLRISDPGDRFERRSEADAARAMAGPAPRADSPADGHDATGATAAPTGPAVVQRAPGDKKYVKKKPTTNTDRTPELRMADRMARLAFGEKSIGTPHLALTLTREDSRLSLAGNTGESKNLRKVKRDQVNQRFARYADEDYNDPEWSDRTKKDVMKYRALRSGDYGAEYPDSPELGLLRAAADCELDWERSLVGVKGEGAQHGEMTLLGVRIEDWLGRARQDSLPDVINMGGVKKACQACEWAFEAANIYIGARYGFEVRASGGHGILFPGWLMPEWLEENRGARRYLEAMAAEKKAFFEEVEEGINAGRLILRNPGFNLDLSIKHNPEDSDSEWDIDDE